MSGVQTCARCSDNFIVSKKQIICNCCRKLYHPACVQLKDTVSKVLNDSENILWFCNMCIQSVREKLEISDVVQNIEKKANEMYEKTARCLEEINMSNKKLHEEIIELKAGKTQSGAKQTYADIASKNLLIIKPKEIPKNITESVINVKQDLLDKVNPAEIGIGVQMKKSTKNGGVVIQCGNEVSLAKAQNVIKENLGERYEIKKPIPYKNRIKILGIHENEHDINNEMLIQKIVKQNDLQNEEAEIRIIYKSKISDKKFSMVIEVSSYIYKCLMKQEKIYLGWNRCKIIEDVGIVRCYKCCGYGHMQSKCTKEEIVCPICAGNHNLADCKSDKAKCINCCLSNEKYKLKLDTEHRVFSKDCPTLRRITQMLRDRYDG